MGTRTHSLYFTDSQLEYLRHGAKELQADYQRRAPFISDRAQDAVHRRLKMLNAAIELLAEPVPALYE